MIELPASLDYLKSSLPSMIGYLVCELVLGQHAQTRGQHCKSECKQAELCFLGLARVASSSHNVTPSGGAM